MPRNMLRSRRTRREAPLDARVPDPIVRPEAGVDPEHEAILGDSLGLALLAVLDPEVVVRSDGGAARPDLVSVVRGAAAVASQAMSFRRLADTATRALVNGTPGAVAWLPDGRPFAVLSATVAGGRIVSIDVLADPDRLARLELDAIPGV